MSTVIERAIEILRRTNDGDDLAPEHLGLVELAVNGRLNDAGTLAFEELYRNAIKPEAYTRPWFHGIEHLTRDQQGYVLWKGKQVEHYDSPWCYSEEGKQSAEELARRCRHLESLGEDPDNHKIIWRWEDYANEMPSNQAEDLGCSSGGT